MFATVAPGLADLVQKGVMFKSAPSTLHEPPAGFAMSVHGSFKSRDPHANLQVTFMTEVATGTLVADIDIDESSATRSAPTISSRSRSRSRGVATRQCG